MSKVSNIKRDVLLKMRDALNEQLDKQIEDENKKVVLESVGTMSLTMAIDSFNEMLPYIFEDGKYKKVLKKYVKVIKENKDLSRAYNVANALKKPVGVADEQTYVNEAVSILSSCNKKALKEGLEELTDILTYGLSQTGMSSEKMRQLLENSKNNEFNSTFNYVLENKCRPTNLREWSDNKGKLYDYVKNNNTELNESESVNVSDGLEQLKDIVKESEEPWQAMLYNDIIKTEMGSPEAKKALFEDYKEKCIAQIDESVEDADVATKSKLNEMKAKLSVKEFNSDNFYEDITKMAELRSML